MHPRKKISIGLLVALGLIIGYFIKNVKTGLVIGLGLGLLMGGLLTGGKK